jgi:hypothetical protein
MMMKHTYDRTVSLLGVELTIDRQLGWGRDLLALLQDFDASTSGLSPLRGSLRIQRGSLRAVLVYGDAFEPGVRRSTVGLVDEEYGVSLSFPSRTEIVLRTEDPCPEWFSWSLQLLALRSRATFVHAACLERAGKAVLLAARNGFGKTALVGDFVRRGGWRVLSDDLTLLSDSGMCYPYPRTPRVLTGAFERAGRAMKPLLQQVPGLLGNARKHHPARNSASATVNVDQATTAAPLDTLIWLERRAGIGQPQIRPAEPTLAPRILSGTISEFDPRCVRITNIALALGLIDTSSTYGTWIDVLRAGLARVRAYTIAVPASLPLEEMPSLVQQTLADGPDSISQSCA